MASENLGSTVLHEHRKVVTFRHILALINFIAILASTLITRHYVLIRGTSDGILLIINLLCVINFVQIALCITDYITKVLMGKYSKLLTVLSYVFGGIWFGAVVAEFVSGTVVLGSVRIDLGVIAILQLFAAIIAYFIWPHIDYSTVRKLTHKNVREDADKRAKKARGGVLKYVSVCLFMTVLQLGMLLSYKLPPSVYDLFSESRQLQYQLSEDGQSYEVIGIYRGTSSYVNVPAIYNNKPVTKIKSGALSNASFLENHKVDKIDIGTLTTDENGVSTVVSNVAIIESGAIKNDKITELTLPVSVVKIEDGAINSESLKTLSYMAKADFSYSALSCSSLSTVTFSGADAGKIVSLEGMNDTVTLEVAKDSYNSYREKNPEYMSSIRPILADNEFVVDFYTGADYYIESIFANIGEKVEIGYQDLKNDKFLDRVSPAVDTYAYLENGRETGTNGVKADSAFRGWYLDPSYNTECVFDKNVKVSFTGDTAIYAKWIDEYTGTLDWGTYHPEGQPSVLYWTDEDPVAFPVIKDREGFDGGIVWSLDDQTVTGSQNISKSTTVSGKWLFNPPTVDINPYAQSSADPNFVISTDKNTINFIYDEYQMLHLEALMQHEFDGRDKFGYSTEWSKVGNTEYASASKTIDVQNVVESGEYILKVIATSPFGDTSVAETRVNVEIAKKELDIGTAKLDNTVVEYNAQYQSLAYVGDVVHERVQTIYKYYDSEGKEVDARGGVKDAGKYKVVAYFEKNNADEAANYGTKELNAEFVITPCELSFVSWSADELVYNTGAQSVYLEVGGIRANDSVEIIYEGNRETNAGSYVAKAIGVSNPNYSISDMDADNKCTHTWKILPKEISVKEWRLDGSVTGSFKITYNGQTHKLEAIPDGVFASDIASVSFIYDQTANTVSAVNANTYTAKIIGVDNPNYELISESSQAWEIEKRNITVSFDGATNLVYNGGTQNVVATVSGIVAGDLPLFGLDEFTYEGKSITLTVADPIIDGALIKVGFSARNVADYNAVISGINTASPISLNYTLTSASKSFSITPKTITVDDSTSYVYNGTAQTIAVKIDGIEKSDLDAVSYDQFTATSLTNGAVTGGSFVLTMIAKDAGSYSYKVTSFDNPNYRLVGKEGNLEISKKPLEVNWKIIDLKSETAKNLISGAEVIYNFAGYTVEAEISGLVNGESVVLDYLSSGGVNAGSYTTSVTLPASYTNYAFDGESVNWKITPYVLDFTWSFNKSYTGGKIPTFTYDAKPVVVSAVYTPLGTDTVLLTYTSGKSDLTKTDASTYNIEVSSLDNSNYVIGTGNALEWRIAPKTVNVNWASLPDSVTYNGEKRGPVFSLEGLSEDGIYAQISINGALSYVEITSFEDVTRYNLANTGAMINADDYTCTVTGIYRRTAPSVYEKYQNYTVACEAKEYTINRAPLTLGVWQYATGGVKAVYTKDTKLVYNAQNYTLTTAINEALFTREGVTDNVYLSYTNNSNKLYSAGGYTVKVTLGGQHSDNYYINGTTTLAWRIEQKPIALNWISGAFVYNGTYQYQNANCTYGATTDDDMKVYDGDSISLTYSGNGSRNAGSFTATVLSIGNSNYRLESGESYSWSIAPKQVSYDELTWSQKKSYVYNGSIQRPEAYYYDTETRENIWVYEYTYSAESRNVGSYTAKANKLGADGNYLLVGVNNGCDYTVTPKPISFTWGYNGSETNAGNIVYDGTERTVTAYPNALGGDTVNLTYNTSNRKIKAAGKYSFSVVDIDNDNYILESGAATASISIEIGKRPIALSWGYDGKTTGAGHYSYTGTQRVISAYASNICAGDEIEFTYSKSSNRNILNAGDYTITVESVDNANYVLPDSSYCKKTITVSPQILSISWSGDTVVTYDGNAHTLVATLKGSIAGENITVTPKYDGNNSFTDASSIKYTVKVVGMGTSSNTKFDERNFALPQNASQSITINQQELKISWSGSKSVIYSGSEHKLVAELVGTINGVSVKVEPVYQDGKNGAVNAGSHIFRVTDMGGSENDSFNSKNFKLPSNGTQNVSLTIAPRQAYVKWEGATTVTYDGMPHTLIAKVTDGINGSGEVVGKYTSSVTSFTNAGVHPISVMLNDAKNYTLAGQTTEMHLTIEKRAVSVSWSGETSVVYDGKAHSLTATVTDVNGKSLVKTHKNNAKVSAGTYTVSFELTDPDNYEIAATSEATKRLTIRPQPVKIIWHGTDTIVYDGRYHSYRAAVIGKNDSSTVNIKSINYSYADVGTYEYNIELDTANYTLDGCEGNTYALLTILPAPVKITWSGANVYTYDGWERSLTPIITGADGKDLSYSYQGEGSSTFVNAGTYTYTVTEITNSNYTLDNCDGSLTATATVKPATVSISWSGNSTYSYTGQTYSMIPTIIGSDGMDVSNYYIGDGTQMFSNAGTYSFTITEITHQNYTTEGCTGSLTATATVTPLDVRIVWSSVTSVKFDNRYHTRSVSVIDANGKYLGFAYTTPNQFWEVGTHTLTIAINGISTNYNIIEGSLTATLTIVE